MANGIIPLPSKPLVDTMEDEDTVVIIQDGAVKRARKSAVSSMPITDEDAGDVYKVELVARNGHLCIDLTRIE